MVVTLIGAESTGKTTLARDLAKYFDSPWIAEYARFYVEQIRSDYGYEDVVNIAKAQIWLWEQAISARPKLLFMDTDLVITKYWFLEVYGRMPQWLDEQLKRMLPDLYLFCDTDLPWEFDPARENPGERRQYLSQLYLREIQKYNVEVRIVKGIGRRRFDNALKFVNLAQQRIKNDAK
jgi:NadR type nicotinamide-nucleotide adenylyltransferase